MRSVVGWWIFSQGVDDVLGSREDWFVFFFLWIFELLDNILAIFDKRIGEAFWHEDVTTEDNAQGWSFDFIDAMGKMIMAWLLLEGELKLADGLLDLDLKDNVLSGTLGQSIIHLDDMIPSKIAHIINCLNGIAKVIHCLVHHLGPQQIADLAFGFDVCSFPLDYNVCDFFDPYVHDLMDNISYADMTWVSCELLLAAYCCIDFTDYQLNSLCIDFFLEHFLEDSEDYLELFFLIFRDFHPDSIERSVWFFLDVID